MNRRLRNRIEIAINALLWMGWIGLLNSGTENGIGYFHQPDQDLLVPLVNGSVFNAITFFGNAFWLMPHYLLPHRFSRYFSGIALLFLGVIAFKTLAERLIILVSMPGLLHVPLGLLALENVYAFLVMLLLSLCYRFGRDWIFGDISRRVEKDDFQEKTINEIWIKSGTSVERVLVEEILFVEAADNYVTFILKTRRLLTLMTMNDALALLPANRFIRIHRSYIVSLKRIRNFSKNRLNVTDVTLPIGKTFRQNVQRRLAEKA